MVFRRDEVIRLDQGGPVVRLFRSAEYRQASVTLQHGDVLVLFTDGISEAMNASEEEWEEERLIPSVRKSGTIAAGDLLAQTMQDADIFVGRRAATRRHDADGGQAGVVGSVLE